MRGWVGFEKFQSRFLGNQRYYQKDQVNHAKYPYLILFYHKKPETGQNHEKRISKTLSWSLQNHFLMDYTSFHTYLWQFQREIAQFYQSATKVLPPTQSRANPTYEFSRKKDFLFRDD